MKRIIFLAVIALIGTQSIAQKGNTSSANLSLQNYFKERGSDPEAATRELKDAKEFIDLSWAIEEWKNDAKTCMVYGKTHLEIAQWASVSGDEDLMKLDLEKTAEDAFAAFDKCFELAESNSKARRWADDVEEYCLQYYIQLKNVGAGAYDKQDWAMASLTLIGAGEFSKYTGTLDTASFYFGGLAAFETDSFAIAEEGFKRCVEYDYEYSTSIYYLSQSMLKQGKADEAEKMLKEEIAKDSKNMGALIEMVNLYIEQDKKEEAIKVLTDAIALSPDNAQLLLTAGTIHENLGNVEESEKAYLKCLELEPKNTSAAFGLGGLYFNKGADLNNTANTMNLDDPEYQKTKDASKSYLEKAVPFLERAHDSEPKDKVILQSLLEAYKKTSNIEKVKETKAKIAALSAE